MQKTFYKMKYTDVSKGLLAQLVEHWSNKPRVAGSSPVRTIFLFFFKLVLNLKNKKIMPRVGFEPTPTS